jgi:hypothetical protein
MRRLFLVALVGLAACGGTSSEVAPVTTATAPASLEGTTTTTGALAPAPTGMAPSTTTSARRSPATTSPPTTLPGPVVLVRYVIEVRSPDPSVADFPTVVEATLGDGRGWERAAFELERTADAPYRVVIAEPADAQALCRPYDVYSKYSCQNGPLVVINAERWRQATPEWTGDLATYRQMVVNHEFGHLLGQHHPRNQCPVRGRPAAVMSQQSTELNGCLPNPWPLEDEIRTAARHDQPLAPPYSR